MLIQIREDAKSGVYVENLTEEQVCTKKDVTQLFDKGVLHHTCINSCGFPLPSLLQCCLLPILLFNHSIMSKL